MKLKEGFITADNHAYRDLIRNSRMGSFIVGCLAEETTEAAILEQLRALYDVPGSEVEAAVADLLDKLRKSGALEE